jgi:flagellar basal-body rod protein FlgF
MDSTTYVQLNRQQGLSKTLDVIANNIANMNTTGYQKEAIVFSEYIHVLGLTPQSPDSVSMATGRARYIDTAQGQPVETGNSLDLALKGDGYFMIETPQGNRLTRNGHFALNDAGEMVTPDGLRLLDIGGGPVFIPPQAKHTSIAIDGTVSADGAIVGRVGVFTVDPITIVRQGDGRYNSTQAPAPVEDTQILQGFVEASNVNPIDEMTRMIEVQRAYEAGMNMMQAEHDRTQTVIQTLGRPV